MKKKPESIDKMRFLCMSGKTCVRERKTLKNTVKSGKTP